MMKEKQEESGQIVVLLALAFLALLIIAALAIDGGMIYSERRFAQNGADAASLGGGGWAANYLEDQHITYESFTCTNTSVTSAMNGGEDEAVLRASSNNYAIEKNNPSTSHGVVTECVNNPADFDKHIDVKVKVTSETSTAFAHLFFPDNLTTTTEAVTRIEPRRNVAYGFAIASLGSTCAQNDGGVEFDGTVPINITGGGIFSNSCIEGNGNTTINVNNAGIGLVDSGLVVNGGASFVSTGGVSGNHTAMPIPIINPPPNCGSSPAQNIQITGHNSATLNPGNYTQIRFSGDTLTLNPGVYCVSGVVRFAGGTVNGTGVTFYLTSNSDFIITAGAIADLQAPNVDPETNPLGGLLIYRDPAYDGNVALEGGGLSYFSGTILAPSGDIDVGGNSGIRQTYSTQLIGEFVKVHGNAGVDINFNTSQNIQVPSFLNLIK